MKISIDLITEALEKYRPGVRLSSAGQYSGLRLTGSGKWENEILYIGYGRNITALSGLKNSGLISIGEPSGKTSGNGFDLIVLPETCDLSNLFNYIQNIFETFSKLEADLLTASNNGSYQDIVNVGYRFIKNPIFLMESGHRVIALAPDTDVPADPEWQFIRKNGYPPFYSIKKLKKEGHLNTFKAFKNATFFSPSTFPFKYIISNISINSNYSGRLVAVGSLKTFSIKDLLASKILTEIIEMKMNRDNAFKFLRGRGPVYSILHDLVFGIKIDSNMIAGSLEQYKSQWLKGGFRVLTIPLEQIDDLTFDYYARTIENKLDCCSVLYENILVVILHYNRETDFIPINKIITSFLADNALTGSLSNEFSKLIDLHEFYIQAAVTFKFIERNKKLNFYNDYMIRHLLSYYPPENIPYLCHASVLRLIEYDREKNTRYSETLYAFIRNERNLVKTAKELFIHRNTLLNRIDKIKELLDIDLNDSDTRFHLLLSFKLLSISEFKK